MDLSSAARPFLLTALLLTVASAQEPPQSSRTDTSGVVVNVGAFVLRLVVKLGDGEVVREAALRVTESAAL